MQYHNKGFTLVELAIVITIIGLLIGGVLKGQELLENSRMTTASAQLKANDAGVITFKDVYKALPGDISNPQNFIQNCTTSPCNISGNGDGTIGTVNNSVNDENYTFWMHLGKANLISGIDTTKTFTAATYRTMPPDFKLGGKLTIVWFVAPAYYASYVSPLKGYAWELYYDVDGSGSIRAFTEKVAGKFDIKLDDGLPLTGSVRRPGAATYDPNSSADASCTIDAGF